MNLEQVMLFRDLERKKHLTDVFSEHKSAVAFL
jgi:hypothetical protein